MANDKLKDSEKLDLILKYMKSAKRWRMVSAFFSFIFFLVFIVLPIVGIVYLSQFVKENVDFDELQKKIEEVKEKAGDLDELTNLLDQIPR